MKSLIVRKAFLKSLPVMAGYIVLGIGFGILLGNAGYGVVWSAAMAVFIYAGSMQYVGVSLLAGGAGILAAILTTVMVNARHLFYGISMIERYRDAGRAKPYMIFTLTDVELASDYSKYYEQHLEYEEAMLRLFEISRTGTINADRAGRISGIKDSNIGPVREGGEEYTLVLLNNVPDPPDPRKDPPKNFINRFALVAQVRFGTMVVYLQKDKASVGRYDTAGNVALSKCKATKIHSFDGVKFYDFNKQKKTWDEIGPDALTEGDILWFVYDADGVLRWVMRPVQPQPVVSGGGGGAYVEPPFEMFELYETDIAEITPQETVTVEVSIDELDIVSVSEGQSAEITIDALPGRSYTGTVSRIDPNGKNTGGNTRYKVTITIKRDENMLTGMNATAILTVGVTDNVITIPTAALSQRGTRTVVYTAYDPQTRTLSGEREVSIGVSDGETVEITEGLSEGEQVWYTYYETTALPDFFPSGAVETA